MSDEQNTVQTEQTEQDPTQNTGKTSKPRVVNTHIEDGVVTVMHAGHPEPIITFDTATLADKPAVARNLLAYGVGSLLRQAAGMEDPHKSVSELVQRLMSGQWQPGRRPAGPKEVDPVIEALATRLGRSVDYVVGEYIPAFCRKQGLTTSDGKLRMSLAREQLSLHPDLAPIVARIVTQRSKVAAKAGEHFDLGSLDAPAGEPAEREAAE